MRLTGLVVLLISLASGPSAWAFRGHEHTDLGNDALAMAIAYLRANERYLCSESRTRNCLDESDFERLEELLPEGDRITYGHLAAAVDHVVNPIKFLERSGYVACYPSDADQLYASHVLGDSQLLAWRASHVNEMHFQGEGMAAMHLALGTDSFISTTGEVERSPTVRFGVTFSMPMTRIPVVQRAAKARLRAKREKFLSRFEIPEGRGASSD